MSKLPAAFLNRMKLRFDEGEFTSFQSAYRLPSQKSIRLNPCKLVEELDELPAVDWYQFGKKVSLQKQFITDPLWHAGAYYVQEASSMILGTVFQQIYPNNGPQRALDLCAAPGGKSTLLQTLLDKDALLVANETIKLRAQILKENHVRLGISENIIITQNDPKQFAGLKCFFDYMQIDAPCSGEGMFRKDKIALQQWSESNCNLCVERQQRILSDVAECLSESGILVYSTCTFNPKENEEMMHWFCEKYHYESIVLHFPPDWKISEVLFENIAGYYFYPHRAEGEGLYISVLRKKTGGKLVQISSKNIRCKEIKLLNLIGNKNIVNENGRLIYETEIVSNLKNKLHKILNIIYSGVELGELKGQQLIPAQALANSCLMLHDFPTINVNIEEALLFLRGHDPQLRLAERGFYQISYRNLGLGWIKYLDNRSNNYYPKSWRIKRY